MVVPEALVRPIERFGQNIYSEFLIRASNKPTAPL